MPNPIPDPPAHVPASPGRGVLWVLWLTLGLNLLSATLKLAVGLLSRNLTVLSDSMHGYLDAANNVVGIIAIKVSWLPPDANHPYGHRKFEALASLAIGALMTLTSWEILKAVGHRFFSHEAPGVPTDSALFLAIVLVGLIINIFVSHYELNKGRLLNSTFLIADALHTRSDILVTIVSLSSLLIAPIYPMLDGVLSLIIVGFILHTGWRVVRDSALLLTDAAQMDPEPIRQLVESIPGVENCHAIRNYGMPDAIRLDLHIVVKPNLTAAQTHEIEAEVRKKLMETYPEIADVSIHHQTQMPVTSQPFTRHPAT